MKTLYNNNFVKAGGILDQSLKHPSFDLDILRHKDFSRFIDGNIRIVGEKKQTLCPFHEERTPSFVIYPDNSYHCFGCGAHGNAIDFLINKFGYSFKEACEILNDL